MEITLVRANIQDAENLWKMQIVAFQDLYAKYQDPETSPATETLEKTILRLEQPYTYFYYIKIDDTIVGAIRVIDHKEEGKYKFLSPIFIMKEFRGRGYAQQAMQLAEEIHGSSGWELDTILQEKGNCHLYEKMGYRQTGETKVINKRMTLIFYKKDKKNKTMKNRIENCNLKTTIQGALCGALTALIVVPFMVLLAHIVVLFDSVELYGYSLENRFEAVYCFNVPDTHTYYYSTPVINGYVKDHETTRERYMASPYITYGLIILGSVTGVILAKRRKNN